MNRLALTASVALAALALTAGTASADPAAFAGTYVGVDIGYGTGQANSERYGSGSSGPYNFTQGDADIHGVDFGAHAGHNLLLATKLIIGVEAGVNYSQIEGDDSGNGGDNNAFSSNWEASLQAHLGLVITDTTMIYATGGYSWLGGDSEVTDPGEGESVSETFSGLTLGAGVEVTLAPELTGRLQYRHTKYDEQDLVFPANGYHMETGPSISDVSLGVSWRM